MLKPEPGQTPIVAGTAELRQSVEASIAILVRPEAVWQTIEDFAHMDRWLPGIRMLPSEKSGTDVGAERVFDAGGKTFRERLNRLDSDMRVLEYALIEGPVPVREYIATVSVEPAGESQSVVRWKAVFVPMSEPHDKCAKSVRRGLEGALAGLKAFLERSASTDNIARG